MTDRTILPATQREQIPEEARTMTRKTWLVITLMIAGAAVLWIVAGSGQAELKAAMTRVFGTSKTSAQAKTKPICSQVVVPAGDCIPQHLANLPPDPGPEGMKTIEGVDSDKDGVRDDVQRYIAEKWGHSERAVKALTLIAKTAQERVLLGDDKVTRDEAYEIAQKSAGAVRCYVRSVDLKIQTDRALDYVTTKVTNTPKRFERYEKFDDLLAHRFFPGSEASVPQACGYDPATLPN